MSTSDDERRPDDPTAPDETATPDEPTSTTDASPAEPPTSASGTTSAPEPTSTTRETVTTEPPAPAAPAAPARPAAPAAPAAPVASTGTATSTGTAASTDPVEPDADTGRHAAVRPEPTPPPPVRTSARDVPVVPPSGTTSRSTGTEAPDGTRVLPTTAPATTAPALAATTPSTTTPPSTATQPASPAEERPGTVPPAGVATPASTAEAEDPRLFPTAGAPRPTSIGTHVLGAVVGVVLTPLAAAVLLLGQSRILAEQVVGWDASIEWSGVVLVALGLLALGWVAVLATWTPAAPLTGGGILTVLGVVALVTPDVVHTQVVSLVDASEWRTTAVEVTVAGTSGTLLVAGFLVLLAGVVAAAAHRRGLRLGALRERHR